MLSIALAAVALAAGSPPPNVEAPRAEQVSRFEAHQNRVFGNYKTLREIAARCPGTRVPDPRNHAFVQVGAILTVLNGLLVADPAKCPGAPEAALADLRHRIGDVNRGDAYLPMLELARRAAEKGLGMPRDPALADRYARILWLYSAKPAVAPRWTGSEQDVWMTSPEAVALLEARVDASEDGTIEDEFNDENIRVVKSRFAELRLRRDIPGYDPARSVRLFERLQDALRVGELLSDGRHVPPDYRRAARLLLRSVSEPPEEAKAERALLLRIAKGAGAAAKTPVEEAQAMRLYFAASVHDRSIAAAEFATLMRRSGPWHRTPLEPRDAECASNFTSMDEIADMLKPFADVRPAGAATVQMRGLIGPDNRLVWVDVMQSSGSQAYDEALLRAWARVAGRIRMWGTARGKFTLIDMPPIPINPGRRLSDACLGTEFEEYQPY